MADILLGAYSPNVSIQLGRFSYPDIHGQGFRNDLSPNCGALPFSSKQRSLRWRLDIENLVSVDGSSKSGRVAIRALKNVPMEFPLEAIALVTAKGKREVLAQLPIRADFARNEFSKMGILRKGSKVNVTYVVSPTSCRKDLGWALPPGVYEVHFRVSSEISPSFPFQVR